jgi:aminopeptidase N
MLALLVSLVALAADPPRPGPPTPVASHVESAAKARPGSEVTRPPALRVRALAPPADPLAALTDVLHYRLDLQIDPAARRLTGSNEMTVRCVVAVSTFHFRLDSLFTIGAVTVDGVAASWQRLDSETVEVALDRQRAAGETFVLVVPYDGFPTSLYGSMVFATHAGQPIAYTLSEPWYAYTWWPAKDDNGDKATADLYYTVPAGMVVAANGRLVAVEPAGGGRSRYHWATAYDTAPYLISFSATNYTQEHASATVAGAVMPVDLFLYPESDTAANRSVWLAAATMIEVFGTLFGPYPFAAEKYGIYQWPVSGGMEHQTITGEGSFLEYLTAHELAHQWWGDLVTCATWHDIWLNEGFATYAEALWYEHKPGSTGAAALRETMEQLQPSSVSGTVYCFDDTSPDRIFSSDFSYLKAGWVLHMLRHVIGDDAFFAVLAAWRAEFAFSAATTADFQRVAERVSGRGLDWFFQEWVYSTGAPAYRYGWRAVEAAGRHYLELSLQQSQLSYFPTFAMPVDVSATTGAGATERAIAWNDARNEYLLLPVGDASVQVTLDPDHWILRTAIQQGTFVAGPPKIVATTPPPGSLAAPGSVTEVDVVFHEDVAAHADSFSLAGARTGPVPVTLAYDAATFTVRLTASVPLAPDAYALTVHDTLTSATGVALDGEVAGSALPSGDGIPGGDAVIAFTVGRPPRHRISPAR